MSEQTIQPDYGNATADLRRFIDAACVPLYAEIAWRKQEARQANESANYWMERAEKAEQEATDYRAALDEATTLIDVYLVNGLPSDAVDWARTVAGLREALAKHPKADA